MNSPLDTLLYIDLSHAHATHHLHIYVAVSGVCVACRGVSVWSVVCGVVGGEWQLWNESMA